MGVAEEAVKLSSDDMNHEEWSISQHTYSDLTKVSPVVFLYLLKECYLYGTRKASAKVFALHQHVLQALHNKPRPGPAVFVAHCLFVLPVFEPHCERFSQLMIAALRRFLETGATQEDFREAQILTTRLFISVVRGTRVHDDKILLKMLEVFDIKLTNFKEALFPSDAKVFIDHFVSKLSESQSYMTAVTLLEHLSIRDSKESFLDEMLGKQEYKAAEKWAAFIGTPMLRSLIRCYVDQKRLKEAFELIKKNDLREEFPEVCQIDKESTLVKLAKKGLWDLAETKAKSDRRLLECLVYLAMKDGCKEKVDELSDRYSLKDFVKAKEAEATLPQIQYLHLADLAKYEIIWVDEAVGLREATRLIEKCQVIGLDCEWKPNYEKGRKNKVSIMQIASEKTVFIIDLIKLSHDALDVLDSCLIRIFHSLNIMKLGYGFHSDMKELSQSYQELDCFKYFEMLLDIQKVFKESRGGLSGLTKEVLGCGLDKTQRNSNWEERPLTQNQLEYAALDAAVLIHIFLHVRKQPQMQWKCHIISQGRDPTKMKKVKKEKGSNTGQRNSSTD